MDLTRPEGLKRGLCLYDLTSALHYADMMRAGGRPTEVFISICPSHNKQSFAPLSFCWEPTSRAWIILPHVSSRRNFLQPLFSRTRLHRPHGHEVAQALMNSNSALSQSESGYSEQCERSHCRGGRMVSTMAQKSTMVSIKCC